MAKGIKNEDRENYFSRFNGELLAKIMSFRGGGNKASRNYRGDVDLDDAFIEKLKEFKHQNLTKTDVIESKIAEFVYGDQRKNTLTAKGAIGIIAKGGSSVSNIAKTALESNEGIEGFTEFVKDSKKEPLIEVHGKDVIEAILNN